MHLTLLTVICMLLIDNLIEINLNEILGTDKFSSSTSSSCFPSPF